MGHLSWWHSRMFRVKETSQVTIIGFKGLDPSILTFGKSSCLSRFSSGGEVPIWLSTTRLIPASAVVSCWDRNLAKVLCMQLSNPWGLWQVLHAFWRDIRENPEWEWQLLELCCSSRAEQQRLSASSTSRYIGKPSTSPNSSKTAPTWQNISAPFAVLDE